jgi:hypothetical protein
MIAIQTLQSGSFPQKVARSLQAGSAAAGAAASALSASVSSAGAGGTPVSSATALPRLPAMPGGDPNGANGTAGPSGGNGGEAVQGGAFTAPRTLLLLRLMRYAAAKPIWLTYLPGVPPA